MSAQRNVKKVFAYFNARIACCFANFDSRLLNKISSVKYKQTLYSNQQLYSKQEASASTNDLSTLGLTERLFPEKV